jgi:hypothetical protein
VIAFLNRKREYLPLIIALTAANRDNFALRRLILSAIRNNYAATGGAYFFYATDQNTVVQWGEFRSHA